MSRGARELGQAEVHTEGLQGESRTALALKRVGCGAVDSREGCPREGGVGVSKADAYSTAAEWPAPPGSALRQSRGREGYGNHCCEIRLDASLRSLRFTLKAMDLLEGSWVGEGWHDQNSVSRR